MGCLGAKEGEMSEEKKNKKTIKVAILGTAACGKSTFFKQMQILYGTGFDDHENENYTRILRGNFINGIKELIHY